MDNKLRHFIRAVTFYFLEIWNIQRQYSTVLHYYEVVRNKANKQMVS